MTSDIEGCQTPDAQHERADVPSPPAGAASLDVTSILLELGPDAGLVSWPELFGNDRPVELEIGSGKGLFLANAAASFPEHNYFGIELARKYARLAAERLAKRKLANARLLSGDARRFMSRCVPEGSLAAVHVYFPDPWWKKRHRKRRVFTNALVVDIERALTVGGVLRVATDVEEYFGVICTLIGAHPRFAEEPLEPPRPAEHDLDYLTNFERKYRIEGRPIFRKNYRLLPAD